MSVERVGERVRRILVAVPHDGLRRDVVRAVEAIGYQAVEQSLEDAPGPESTPWDARIADLDGWSGTDAIDAAGSLSPPTIWLTGRAGIPHAPGVDPATTLAKPFSVESLERRLHAVIADGEGDAAVAREAILRTESKAVRMALARARRWASGRLPIVIEGELGSGRRALARAIHAWSSVRGEAYVWLDEAAVRAEATSGAAAAIASAVRRAAGGSLVLIEPGDWAATAQGALAAALRIEVGRPRCLTLTRTPLARAVEADRLPRELEYRLDAVSIRMPPLRARPEDQQALCEAIARRVARRLGRPTPSLPPALVEAWREEGFPGNEIGLESRLRSAILRDRPEAAVAPSDGRPAAGDREAASLDLKQLERDTIVRALAHHRGNRTHASASLGISVRTLRNKIRDYGLR